MTTNTKRNMISTSFGNVFVDSPSASISILREIFGMATSLCPAWGKNPRLSTHTSEYFTIPKAYG